MYPEEKYNFSKLWLGAAPSDMNTLHPLIKCTKYQDNFKVAVLWHEIWVMQQDKDPKHVRNQQQNDWKKEKKQIFQTLLEGFCFNYFCDMTWI